MVLGVPLCKGVPVLYGVEVKLCVQTFCMAVGYDTGSGKIMKKSEGEGWRGGRRRKRRGRKEGEEGERKRDGEEGGRGRKAKEDRSRRKRREEKKRKEKERKGVLKYSVCTTVMCMRAEAWDQNYVTDWKWWTWLVCNVDSVCTNRDTY